MAKIILDTCSWIDLAKPRFTEILDELEKQIKSENLVLLTNDIIIDEWKRNRERIAKEIVSSIKANAKSALQLGNLMEKKDNEILLSLLEKYKSIEKEQIALAELHISKVEKLLFSGERVSINNELKLFVLERALTTLAPFHNKKNNVADALIFYSIARHMKKYEIAIDLLFISMNYKEFCDPIDHSKLHLELLGDVKGFAIHFFDNVGQALKMKSSIVDELDEYHEYQFWDWIDTQAEIARGK